MESLISEEERKRLIKAVKRQLTEVDIGRSPYHFAYYNMLCELLKIYRKKVITAEDIRQIEQLRQQNKDAIDVVNYSQAYNLLTS